jgi:hypothetical protein
MEKTIPGSTTPEVRGRSGSVTFSLVIGLSFCNAVMAKCNAVMGNIL